jgi:hypothetical protein
MSKLNYSALISEVANQVINVRDFCGSKKRENEVAKEELLDNGIQPTTSVMSDVFSEVNRLWRNSQKEANVKPEYQLY